MDKVKKEKYKCLHCGKSYVDTNYYGSNSVFFGNDGKLPYCKQCIERLFQYYSRKYANDGYPYPERKAIKRLCMAFDIYYKEDVFNSAIRNYKESDASIMTSPMGQYMRLIQLTQYNRNKETYENTLEKECQHEIDSAAPIGESTDFEADKATIDFFGSGFSNEDYEFLKREYEDWTARHECKTKAQEEVFKDICFNRLQNLKALRKGEETKDITAAFQKLLDSGKLQPKQNAGDAMSDAQTFGTLIDKWENTRPIPEVEEELKDVDKIGLLIHTFYTGHIAKVLNLPSSLTALYDKFMKKYTVEKQEYGGNSDNEALFNSIFGKKNIDEQDEQIE